MKSEQKIDEITNTLLDFGVKMSISAMMLKMMSDAYKDNPSMFWAYRRSKYRNMMFNCRM